MLVARAVRLLHDSTYLIGGPGISCKSKGYGLRIQVVQHKNSVAHFGLSFDYFFAQADLTVSSGLSSTDDMHCISTASFNYFTRNRISDIPFRFSSSTCNFFGDTLGDEKGLVATHVLTLSCRTSGLVGTGRIKIELSSSFSLSLSEGSKNTSFLPNTDFLLPPKQRGGTVILHNTYQLD